MIEKRKDGYYLLGKRIKTYGRVNNRRYRRSLRFKSRKARNTNLDVLIDYYRFQAIVAMAAYIDSLGGSNHEEDHQFVHAEL